MPTRPRSDSNKRGTVNAVPDTPERRQELKRLLADALASGNSEQHIEAIAAELPEDEQRALLETMLEVNVAMIKHLNEIGDGAGTALLQRLGLEAARSEAGLPPLDDEA